MKKNLLMPLAAALLLLAGCDYNDDNFEGLEESSRPTNVFSKEYTLLAEDYATISKNKTNEAKAKADGVASQLTALATNQYFTGTLPAQDYIPAYLAARFYTADENSAVKLTYQEKQSLPEYLTKLNAAKIYTLAAADYQATWGAGSTLNFFTPEKPAASALPAVLLAKVETPAAGDLVCATYNYSTAEPAPVAYAFKEDFETGTVANTNINNDTWTNVTVTGTYEWQAKLYGGNLYAQQSANKHVGVLDSYLISKELTIESGMSLELDASYVYYVEAGGRIQVLVSSNLTATTAEGINAATWTDLTSNFNPPTSTSGSGDATPCGSASLSAFASKKIRIAIRYQGDGSTGATTTARVDNIAIKTPGKNTYTPYNALYAYDGTKWAPYTANNALMLGKLDFAEFGVNYDNLSAVQADNYLPLYLKQKYPYALEGDVKVPVYKLNVSPIVIRADKYEFINGQFVKDTSIETVTSQFVFKGGQWKFDPSTIITLLTTKGDPISVPFYTAIVNEVKAIHPSFITSYGDGEYYYGASSYNNNFDFRPAKWRELAPSAYESYKNDADLIKLMYERIPEALEIGLKKLYSDAKPVEGITVIYTVNFSIYDGSATLPWTIQFEVTAPATFSYIKDSLKKVEK